MENKEKLFNLIKSITIINGDFILSSGKRSDYFVDCKRVLLNPEYLQLACTVLFEEIMRDKSPWLPNFPKAIAGVALGGCPLATGISLLSLDLFHDNKINNYYSLIYVRPETKDHGSKKRVEGLFETNTPCIVIEDVITTGTSTLNAIKALELENVIVLGVIALINRNEGCNELLSNNGYLLSSIFNISDLIGK